MRKAVILAGLTASLLLAQSAVADDIAVVVSESDVATLSSQIASAKSPEDAARMFAQVATQMIGQAVADSLQRVLSQASTQSAENASIKGWEQFILDNGLAIDMSWPSPAGVPSSNLPVYLLKSRPPQNEAAPASFEVSIGIKGTF